MMITKGICNKYCKKARGLEPSLSITLRKVPLPNKVLLLTLYQHLFYSCYISYLQPKFFYKSPPLRSSANIALNKQEIRITRYIRKRVTVLTLLLGKLWPPQYFSSLQDDSIAVHKCNTYLLFVFMYYIGDYVLANTWSLK